MLRVRTPRKAAAAPSHSGQRRCADLTFSATHAPLPPLLSASPPLCAFAPALTFHSGTRARPLSLSLARSVSLNAPPHNLTIPHPLAPNTFSRPRRRQAPQGRARASYSRTCESTHHCTPAHALSLLTTLKSSARIALTASSSPPRSSPRLSHPPPPSGPLFHMLLRRRCSTASQGSCQARRCQWRSR